MTAQDERAAVVKADLPTPEQLRNILGYDPDTGLFGWLPRSLETISCPRRGKGWNKRYAGKPAARGIHHTGYHQVEILGKFLLAHRVAWAIHYGEWPNGKIDHINGNPTDNRIVNLRVVTDQQNCMNSALRSDSNSGVTGVTQAANGKWVARITHNKRLRHIGTFDDRDSAAQARRSVERELGFHPNHGRKPVKKEGE